MVSFECRECGKEYSGEDVDHVVEKAHAHMHVEHGKHVSTGKLKKRIE
ncbi:MAG: hypothetical protein ABEJ91_02820 [Candidatus Nanohaloarchaea archaeon]